MATAIVRRPIAELIQSAKPQFLGRLPQGMSVDRFMYSALTVIQKNPDLGDPTKTDQKSLMLALYEAAEVGCDLSLSRQLGFIIKYKDQAQFQPSYRLFIQKAYESGCVRSFYAEVVYRNDNFVRQFAPKRSLTHQPPHGTDERGEPIGCYALIEFMDGRLDWEYLTKEQIQRHRNASKAPDSLMWKTFWEEGWRKTPIRVLAKRIPASNPAMEKLAELVEADAERDTDLVIPGQLEVETVGEAAPAAVNQPAQEVVYYHVGKHDTVIQGNWKVLPDAELKPLDRKISGAVLVLPAISTQDFLNICTEHNVHAVETDENGRPVQTGMFEQASA